MAARLTLMALVLCAATLCGCSQGTAPQSGPRRPRRGGAGVVARGSLGHTTADDAERQFGAPDERAGDGSLVYRFETVRRRGGQTRTETETVTLRFARGVGSKICPPGPAAGPLSRRAGWGEKVLRAAPGAPPRDPTPPLVL